MCVRKVNIDTDNRLAITAAVREALAQDTAEFDPVTSLPSIKYMQRFVRIAISSLAALVKVPRLSR